MIAIINISPENTPNADWSTYRLQINRRLIVTFKHRRIDGLAKCLKRASEAVEEDFCDELYLAMELERNHKPKGDA
jgi:hypothetical protein